MREAAGTGVSFMRAPTVLDELHQHSKVEVRTVMAHIAAFGRNPASIPRQHRFALMREKTAAGVVIVTNNSTATKSLMCQRMTLSWSRNRWMHERGHGRVTRSMCRRPIKAMLYRGASCIESAGLGCSVLFKLPWVSVTRSLILWRAGEGQAGKRAKHATPRFPACHDGMMS
jgi:hypothetical protein